MDGVAQISEFGKILIFLITGCVFTGALFFANRLLSKRNPNPEKLSTYECGEEATGSAWLPFNSRFYVIALVFLLFDVEMVFVFPWATVFGNHELLQNDTRWGWLSLTEMFIFLGILILGLVYVWRKGDLEWIKPSVLMPHTSSPVPNSLYDNLNTTQSKYKVRDFTLERIAEQPVAAAIPAPATSVPASETPPVRKPMFKPSFKKPSNDA